MISFQEFACNGTVVEHPEYGEVLQLQGDQVSILMATAALKSLTILHIAKLFVVLENGPALWDFTLK